MKKINFLFLTMLVAMTTLFVACDKDEVKEANVQFSLNQTSFETLHFADAVQITGTVTADKAITGIFFTGVKKESEIYVAKGDAQEYLANGATTVNLKIGRAHV